MNETRLGLEDVVVAETVLSRVDGEGGRLVLRGHSLDDLAGRRSFEEVTGLLWTGEWSADLAPRLGEARLAAHARLARWEGALEQDSGMDALRGVLGLGLPAEGSAELGILATLAVAVGAWWRRRQGLEPLRPDPALSHAADLLRMIRGAPASPAEAAALDAYLVTVSDHGLNASTFAARVVASTGSDTVSALVAAIGALKGPLHGGAPGPVLDMLDAIGSPAAAPAWVARELAAGRRIMGMGHRVYRARDPRAEVLAAATARLGDPRERLGLTRAVEEAAGAALAARHPGRRMAANVELYTALLLEAVGIDRALFSPVFAVARAAGWVAHVREQRERGRLLRPRARYVGPEVAA